MKVLICQHKYRKSLTSTDDKLKLKMKLAILGIRNLPFYKTETSGVCVQYIYEHLTWVTVLTQGQLCYLAFKHADGHGRIS